MNQLHLIGAGGVGSWLLPSLCLLLGPKRLHVWDGDKLEKKNLNRQLFTSADIGRNKAEALADRYGASPHPEWYAAGIASHTRGDVLLGAVDNHPARRAILESADAAGCPAILAANEVHSAEAGIYFPRWKGTPRDPRSYIPEILIDNAGDPRAAAINCTGEAQQRNTQLVSANFMAAALAQQLVVLWIMEFPKFSPADRESLEPTLPFRLISNLSSLEAIK